MRFLVPLYSRQPAKTLRSDESMNPAGRPMPGRTVGRLLAGLSMGFLLLTSLVNEAAAQCSINKVTTTVSGCYSVSGVSKATVSVEVDWSNAPAGDYIVVTTGLQSRTITPGTITVTYAQPASTRTGTTTIVSPQVVAFDINADNSIGLVTAVFHGNPLCTKISSFTAPAACLPTACSGTALGGMLFKDFNDNGIHEAGETVGVSGATVKAVACDGTTYTTTTDAYGRYTLAVPTAKYPVRVEFSAIPTVYNLGVNGSDSRTAVQFVAVPDCSVDLGVSNPVDYCSNIPQIFVPCYTNGNPLVAGSAASSAALVAIPYGVSSTTSFTGESMLATASQVGSVWGMAFNKATKKLFQSAVLKRHAGLGPAGLGGLYVTDYTNPSAVTTTTFLSVTALGINVGSVPDNAGRGLTADKTQPSHDPQSFSLTAKVGIGDLELAEDGNKLWLMNLYDKKLYSIDVTQYNLDGVTKPTAANVSSFTIPASCTNGEFRPWALKVYNGKVYVGGVCDAQGSGNKSNLRASVYELNGSAFTAIFDFPLTYPKGYPAAGNTNITGWFPWTDTFTTLLDGSLLRHPVPIFTDIEFDIDGSMVLAFGDRTGFQGGDQNYSPDPANTNTYDTNSQAGDILRAFYANGTFVLENNAKAGPSVGFGAGNSQGPGFGEFYNDNWIQDGSSNIFYHAENVMGGLALKPGTGEVVVTTVDPVDKHPFAGGVRYLNNTTGNVTGEYAVYITRGPDGTPNPGTFAKATGLGDIELSCNTITLLEIGSRVWLDDDRDGEQDACEKGLPGVTVSLYKNGTLLANTTTNASGDYFFASKSKLTTGTWSGTGADTTIRANQVYQLAFGTGQYTTGTLNLNPGKYTLTVANATGGTKSESTDSDAQETLVAGVTTPAISLTTGGVGTVNHTYDVGFFCQETSVATITATKATCPGSTTTANTNARIDLTGIVNADKAFLYTTSTPPSYTATGSQPVSASAVSFTGLSNPTSSSGTSYSVIVYSGPCCSTIVTVTLAQQTCTVCSLSATAQRSACNIFSNLYSVTGTVGALNGPASQTLTISSGTASTTAVLTGNGPVSYTLANLFSDGLPHTVSVVSSATTCAQTTVGYTAPVSCSVAPSLLIGLLTPGSCNSATNQYTISGTLNLVLPLPTVLTITDGSVTTTISVGAGQPTASFSLTGLTSGTGSHTLTVSGLGLPLVKQTYQAPVSCLVLPALTLGQITPGSCNSATNGYTLTGALNLTVLTGGLITLTDGAVTTTVSVTVGQPSATFSLTGLTSGTGSHTLTVSGLGLPLVKQTYQAPVSCLVLPALTLGQITPGSCNSATNGYTLTGALNLTVLTGGLITLTDGAVTTTVSVTVGQPSATFSLTGLTSGTGSHTLTVSGLGLPLVSQAYQAPVSCLVLPALTLGQITPGSCQSATNQYTLGGVISLTATVPGSLTITDGIVSQIIGVIAGQPTASFSLTGLTSGTGSHTLTVSGLGLPLVKQIYQAPVSCLVLPSLTLGQITPGSCNSATNQYSVSGTLSFTAAVDALLTIADGANSTSVVVTQGQAGIPFNLAGLPSGTGVHTLTVSGAGYVSTSVSYTAPASCLIVNPAYVLTKTVNKKLAAPGDLLTYTLTVTNTSTVTAQNVVVTDQFTAGLTYGSAVATTGVFVPAVGSPSGGTWAIPALAGGATASLTLTATVTAVGIVYNTAILGSDTVTACTSIPFHVCEGTDYLYRLTAKPGRSAYQWYKNSAAITGATTNTLDVTAPGEYSLAVDDVTGKCADFTCCPFIVIEDALPGSYSVAAVPATCQGPVAAGNGQLRVSLPAGMTITAGSTVQYSVALGGAFNPATAQTVSTSAVAASGVLVSNLPAVSAPVTYVVRVTNAAGCFRDAVATLAPTVCDCKPVSCTPLVIRKNSLGGGQ